MSYDHIRCVADLMREEGFKASAYQDHLGFWTIGYGVCIDERKGCGITQGEGATLLENRLELVRHKLDIAIPWWRELSPARCSALMSMAYQMGVTGLLNFKKMLGHMEAGRFEAAADEALNSTWAEQTPSRAYRVSQQIRTGE